MSKAGVKQAYGFENGNPSLPTTSSSLTQSTSTSTGTTTVKKYDDHNEGLNSKEINLQKQQVDIKCSCTSVYCTISSGFKITSILRLIFSFLILWQLRWTIRTKETGYNQNQMDNDNFFHLYVYDTTSVSATTKNETQNNMSSIEQTTKEIDTSIVVETGLTTHNLDVVPNETKKKVYELLTVVKHNNWIHRRRLSLLKKQQKLVNVPFPIFHVSLPKSGTSSTSAYFNCGQVWASHFLTRTNYKPPNHEMRIGRCMYNNIQEAKEQQSKLGMINTTIISNTIPKPLDNCGNYNVWSDIGDPSEDQCFYPSVHGLDEYYESYPNSTILLITRNATEWADSVLSYGKGTLVRKWKHCISFPNIQFNPNVTNAITNDMDNTVLIPIKNQLIQFYNWHTDRIREFAMNHPSLTYIEHTLDDSTGQQLEQSIGIKESCFGHHNSRTNTGTTKKKEEEDVPKKETQPKKKRHKLYARYSYEKN